MQKTELKSPFRGQIQYLMRKYGAMIRNDKAGQKRIRIKVHLKNIMMTSEFSCFKKVKHLRELIRSQVLTEKTWFLIQIRGIMVDDYEYLVDVGCTSGHITHAKIVIVSELCRRNLEKKEKQI